MIVAGIHGGYEWNTVDLAEKLVESLKAHPEWIPKDLTLFVLPNLNPDGYARSRGPQGRGNARGVDLNRNWGHHWQEHLPGGGCWALQPLSGGREPFSEPETAALRDFLLRQKVEALISYHSAALGIFAGGKPDGTPRSRDLAQAIAQVSPYPYPPIDTGCDYTGTLTDWAAAMGIAAVDVELSTHYSLDWQVNLRILQAFLGWDPPATPSPAQPR
jgi:predicted deacylase